ncbi:MAG TPA: hypothetical protein PLR06_05055, partial [Cyclobacteriaceae bacterium]|nr:hypothetical protein [Cyclobacteriaceae bacterium]
HFVNLFYILQQFQPVSIRKIKDEKNAIIGIKCNSIRRIYKGLDSITEILYRFTEYDKTGDKI